MDQAGIKNLIDIQEQERLGMQVDTIMSEVVQEQLATEEAAILVITIVMLLMHLCIRQLQIKNKNGQEGNSAKFVEKHCNMVICNSCKNNIEHEDLTEYEGYEAFESFICPNCGADLHRIDNNTLKCDRCGWSYSNNGIANGPQNTKYKLERSAVLRDLDQRIRVGMDVDYHDELAKGYKEILAKDGKEKADEWLKAEMKLISDGGKNGNL